MDGGDLNSHGVADAAHATGHSTNTRFSGSSGKRTTWLVTSTSTRWSKPASLERYLYVDPVIPRGQVVAKAGQIGRIALQELGEPPEEAEEEWYLVGQYGRGGEVHPRIGLVSGVKAGAART